MKFTAVFCLFLVFAWGCNSVSLQTRLLSEQRLLKDSANNITERISGCTDQGLDDSAKKVQLGKVHARLISIQASMDSLERVGK